MGKIRHKKTITLILAVCLFFSVFFPFAAVFDLSAFAAGSDDLISNGGYRPYLEYYINGENSTTAGILRQTIINVYMNAGERLCLGSSVMESKINSNNQPASSVTGCDIIVTNPGGTDTVLDVTNSAG